jgi:hypothetical protein
MCQSRPGGEGEAPPGCTPGAPPVSDEWRGRVDLRLKRKFAVLTCTALLVCGAIAPSAGAQQKADGLVVVQIGDITIQDVNVAVAAEIVATACDLVDVQNVAILVQEVDQESRQRTFCRTEAGKVKVTQN